MSLEELLRRTVDEANRHILNTTGVTLEERAEIDGNSPTIEIIDSADTGDTGTGKGIYAAYDFVRNKYLMSKQLLYDLAAGGIRKAQALLAVGEEVGHAIRLRLNKTAREYFISTYRQLQEKGAGYFKQIKDKLIGAHNKEEEFAHLAGLSYLNSKVPSWYVRLFVGLKDSAVRNLKKSWEYITHAAGYKKAEQLYLQNGDAALTRPMIYDTNPLMPQPA